jgi:hypothetical protein
MVVPVGDEANHGSIRLVNSPGGSSEATVRPLSPAPAVEGVPRACYRSSAMTKLPLSECSVAARCAAGEAVRLRQRA